MNDLPVFSILLAIASCACATGFPLQAQSRTPERDRAALIALENEWLANEHNASVLERILASDFVHPLPTGDFVTKAQHIAFSSAHPPPANLKQHFDQMRVRVYGDRLLDAESRIPEATRAGLAERGHEVNVIDDWSWVVGGGQGIARDPESGALMAGADPRRDGYAMAI